MSDTTLEPKIEFTKNELIVEARRYTKQMYPEDVDVRHERLGMLVDFIGELFYNERAEVKK